MADISDSCEYNNLLSQFDEFSDKFVPLTTKREYTFLNQFESIPLKLKNTYKFLDNNIEMYSNGWEFFSLDEIENIYKEYKKNCQTSILDFAKQYKGMGYFFIASIDLNLGKIFVRTGGGQNGYERKDNFHSILNYKTDESLINYMTLDEFIKNKDADFDS